MGLPGDILELRRRAVRKSSMASAHPYLTELPIQSYIYSVVYMATHDPSKYQFSTLTYVALYATLLTAYYM